MRIVTFKRSDKYFAGVVSSKDIADLGVIEPEAPTSLKALIAVGIPQDLASSPPASARFLLAGAGPSDLIPTGTPAGVGTGRKPPVWLRPSIDIEDVGILTNPVVAANTALNARKVAG